MGDPIVDPGGGLQPGVQGSQVRPGQTFAGAAQAAVGTVPGGRSWHQIFNDAKETRNILEIHVNMQNAEDNNQPKPIPLYSEERERCTNQNDRGKIGSNRTVDVIINDGASLENF
jgi:hypothetical protein